MKPRLHLHISLLIGCLLSLFLTSCSFPGVYSSNAQLQPEQPVPTAAVLPPIRFPQDESAHRDLTEWWYYTGHFQATEPGGKIHHYGFELVVFQALRSDLPPVYASHFAISDIDRAEFHYDQRRQLEPNAIIPNGNSTQGINVSLDNWQIQGLNGQDHLQASMPNYAIDLNLQALKPPTLHNGNGLITYGIGGFSYYYSRTRMALSGLLLDHNQPLQVTGQAWMDHQWGNFLTLGGGGWDWYSVQLNNQSEMMIYFIRDATGKTISTYVGYIDPSGKDFLLPANSVKQTVLDHWLSPTTGISYPSGWKLDINDPHLRTTLTIIPQLKNQELVAYQSTGNTYWEGSVDIQSHGTGATVLGKGYVELTGYTKS